MFENVIVEIDAQIARLQQARAALSGTSTASTSSPAKKRRGRPPLSVSASSSSSAKKTSGKKRRGMSPEGRARIAAAQKARWAKLKGGK